MRKLLSAHFARLWKKKAFWISIVGIFVISALLMLQCYWRYGALHEQDTMALDSYLFQLVLGFGLLDAVFAATYLGTEYADGTLRNKLIVGHSRRTIYLAGFILCLVVNCCFVAAWLLGSFAMGIPLMGPLRMGLPKFLICLLLLLLSTSAMMGIFTLCGMLSGNKAGTVVICVLVFVMVLLAAAYVYGGLQEPEEISGYMLTIQEGEQTMNQVRNTPNPNYLTGNVRRIYEWILDLLPAGPGFALTEANVQRPWREMACSLLVLICSTGLGLWAFDKKNLK